MSLFSNWRKGGAILVSLLAGLGIVAALALTNSSATGAAGSAPGTGENDFGMTHAFYKGHAASFTYSRGYFCDTSVTAQSSTKCEVGQKYNTAPGDHDPLFITVPLGFTPKKMVDCPANLTCVDHPTTVDMTRLETALKPLYPQYTDAQLTEALKNFMTPEHDHFITTKNRGKAEWWDVQVVGVTSPSVYRHIQNHRSYAYIAKLIKSGNSHVVGPIPSNIFLFFGVHR